MRQLREEAELEAKRIVPAAGENSLAERSWKTSRAAFARRSRLDSLSTVQAAELKAEELLADAEQQCANLVSEAEAEAQRNAAGITAGCPTTSSRVAGGSRVRGEGAGRRRRARSAPSF